MQGVAQCVGWFVLSARGGASVSGSVSERCLMFMHVILTIRITVLYEGEHVLVRDGTRQK